MIFGLDLDLNSPPPQMVEQVKIIPAASHQADMHNLQLVASSPILLSIPFLPWHAGVGLPWTYQDPLFRLSIHS